MPTDRIEQEASEWLARLDGDAARDDVREAFDRWREADPRHEAAYARLTAIWGRLDRAQALRPGADAAINPDLLLETESRHAPAVLSVSVLEPARTEHRTRRRVVGWAAAASLVALVAAGLGALQWNRLKDHYVTGVGGFERVVLTDGSIIELNTTTEVRVAFAEGQRRVELIQGEANFEVAHDASRPFIVTAGGTAVRAVGTQFNVRRRAESVEVLVTEGKVIFGPSATIAASDPIVAVAMPVLAAGQAATVARSGATIESRSSEETRRALSWQSGMLSFEGDTLENVVAEFNRYNTRQLVIEDPDLAALKIGGYFKTTNLDSFVAVLESNFGVRVTAVGDRLRLERVAPTPQ